MKVKPLLSCEVDIEKVSFPIYVSTKFDGIRALVIGGVVYSRSLKPIKYNDLKYYSDMLCRLSFMRSNRE